LTPPDGYSILTTEQIIERNQGGDGKRNQFEIPRQGAAQFPKALLPLDPYVLGVWIGDGLRLKPSYMKPDLEIEIEIKERGYETRRNAEEIVTLVGKSRAFRETGIMDKGSHERFIPDRYRYASVDQRRDLVCGLMDTDGCIADDGHMEYATTSKRLADDLVWMVRSLGGVALVKATVKKGWYTTEDGRKDCRDCYRVTVVLPFNPFRVKHKAERWKDPARSPQSLRYMTRYIKSIESAGYEDSMCIEVEHPSHCYLTNDFIVTHNTAVLAWIGWHRLLCFSRPNEHPKGAAVSITSDNLKDNLWAELARWQNESPLLRAAFVWQKERIFAKDHPETWFLSAKGWSKTADLDAIGRTLSGMHSVYPFYLIDESGDIPPNMVRSAEQGLTSCEDGLIITAGNTTSQTGLLYEVCTRGRKDWHVVSITADPDDPKRTPRVDIEWARENIAKYGRDNPWVMAFILGQFPPGSINALLSIDEVEAAMNRHPRPDEYEWAQKRLGIDVARFGDDRNVIFPRQGSVAFMPDEWRAQPGDNPSTAIAGRVMFKKGEWGSELEFFDDTVGWAHGAVDVMRTAGHDSVHAVQFDKPANNPRYYNIRAEMWMKMADWIKNGGSLPNVPGLITELTAPTYFFNGGKFQIEAKDQIKKRLGRSPDFADALALTFALPDLPQADRKQEFLRSMTQKPREYDPYARM